MTVVFDINETVVMAYDITFDADILDSRGFDKIEDYLKGYYGNPWMAMSEDTLIKDITMNTILDYIDNDCDTINFQGIKMNLTKTVKIKTWEQMEKEFGLDEVFGDIACRCSFVKEMEWAITKDRIIEIYEIDEHFYWEEGLESNEWEITNDMIEEIIKD